MEHINIQATAHRLRKIRRKDYAILSISAEVMSLMTRS